MSDPWIDRLSDYIDGDMTPIERLELEAHLTGCAECSETLAGLVEVPHERCDSVRDEHPCRLRSVHTATDHRAGRRVAAP